MKPKAGHEMNPASAARRTRRRGADCTRGAGVLRTARADRQPDRCQGNRPRVHRRHLPPKSITGESVRQRSVASTRLTGIAGTLIAVVATTLGSTAMANASSRNAAVAPATTQADSGGALISAIPHGTFAPNIPETPRTGLCTGEWANGISDVFYKRGTSGRLY